MRYLLARNEAMRVQIHTRADIARRASKILDEWKTKTRAESLRDVADFYEDKVGPAEPLADPARLRAFIQELAASGTSGARTRVFVDAYMLQELLILLDRDPVKDFARLRPLLRDWAKAGTNAPQMRLAHFFPDESKHQLKKLVRRAENLADRFLSDTKRLERLERSAMRVVAGIGPLQQQLQRLHNRALVCRLCERVFIRQQGKPAQQYCPTCRRRWSKEQLWYKAGGKEKRRKWHTEKRERRHGR